MPVFVSILLFCIRINKQHPLASWHSVHKRPKDGEAIESRCSFCSLPITGSPSLVVSSEVYWQDNVENAASATVLGVPTLSPQASKVTPSTVIRVIKTIF